MIMHNQLKKYLVWKSNSIISTRIRIINL